MADALARSQRILLLTVSALLMVALATACGRLDLRPSRNGVPATPASDAMKNSAEPSRPGIALNGGRPYLQGTLPGATLYYEPWVDYQTVQLL